MFKCRAFWGLFAWPLQARERKCYFQTDLKPCFTIASVHCFVIRGQNNGCLTACALSASLHSIASASSIRSLMCLPNSMCMAERMTICLDQQGYPSAFETENVLCPNGCSLAAVPYSSSCNTTFSCNGRCVKKRDNLLSAKKLI